MNIIGAGLSGLICGALNPGSTIYERQQELPNNHGAVLRFRSGQIGRALGIPFKPVRVTKAIWYEGREVQPHPRFQNMYSRKVTGEYGRRSIANIDPCTRYIAPDDFIQQLAERCDIEYNHNFSSQAVVSGPIISTIPMPVMLKLVMDGSGLLADFHREPIWTRTFVIGGCDIYQTIYFPGAETSLYRASMTGRKMICEFASNPIDGAAPNVGFPAFGFHNKVGFAQDQPTQEQKYGKIIPIDNDIRRSIMAELTQKHNIYSLGRFATWRNILLDDVFEDIFKIRDLMNMDSYSRRLNR